MNPPVEHVRVSTKGRESLIKIKRRTGIEHWNEICRIALCQSLANPTIPNQHVKVSDSSIDIEWKTFAGQYSQEISAVFYLRAKTDGINISSKDELAIYFRQHLDRGIQSIQNSTSISFICQA